MEIDQKHLNTAYFLIRNIHQFEDMVRRHVREEEEVPVWKALCELGAKMDNDKFVALHNDLVERGDFYTLDVLFDITEKMPWVLSQERPKEAISIVDAAIISIAIGGEREAEMVSKLVCDKKFPDKTKEKIIELVKRNPEFLEKIQRRNEIDGGVVVDFPTSLMAGKHRKNQNNGGSPNSIQFAMRH